ncbi:MAG: serine hydrolase domain-containing protein [Flavobacteriales bacterium]
MKIAALVLFVSFSHQIFSQSKDIEIRKTAIRAVMDGYNDQDYKKMKKPWFGLGKLLVSKKSLRDEFAPYFETHGQAQIDTIVYDSKYEYVAQLRFTKRPGERAYMKFLFSEKGKIQGMGFDYPPLVYRKTQDVPVWNKDELSSKIDSLLTSKYVGNKKFSFNGSIMLMTAGQVDYVKHIGYSDFEKKSSINDSTLFDLASCSKQFTSYAIMILAGRDKLSLQDNVLKYLPELPYANITIEHLLTHTSGLPDYEVLLKKEWDKTKFATNEDVLKMFALHHPGILSKPGEYFQYSNAGYVMLALIIERISGTTYADFLEKEIFSPLGMTHTRVYNTRRSMGEVLQNGATGYVFDPDLGRYIIPDSLSQYQVVIYQDAITGDGTVNSCTSDLAKWQIEIDDPKLISQAQLDKMCSNQVLKNGNSIGYGYGFFVHDGPSTEKLVYHTGGWPGYFSIIMRFPELDKSIVILSNNSFDNFTFLADDIAAILLEGENR